MTLGDIFKAAWTMAGWPYGAPPHWPKRPGDPDAIDCCTFAEATILGAARPPPLAPFPWTIAQHQRVNISGSPLDVWGPVGGYCDAGLADAIALDMPPDSPAIMQGWRCARADRHGPDVAAGGHTMLIVGYASSSGRVLVLEANDAASGLNGPGFRGLGPLALLNKLPPGRPAGWELDRRCPTWKELCTAYPLRRLARLRLERTDGR